ncbi:MAG TPA: aminomethyl-transferring glycine dehydrogenase subunit GcvPA [Candidatus Nanoarchaeia archaeon]|nr:aminomethyl-transferring glycine dehydrogenase subunit GcvPA [Candidatus Nanoarchaeia archaeon]
MEYICHTEEDIDKMLKAIKKKNISELFKDVPKKLLSSGLRVPQGLSEIELKRLMNGLASKNKTELTYFLGAGAYKHFIPSVVNHILSKPEFYTAYTPYQPEMSQGFLQAIYEYQSMICSITGMDASNASMYDGASALAESCIMACNITKRNKIIVSRAVHPHYREVVRTYCKAHSIVLEEAEYENGVTSSVNVDRDTAALIIQSPNFFGGIEDIESFSKMVHLNGALLNVCVVEPTSLGILKSPGKLGADIFIGEGQSFGNPVSFGGPYLGILATKKEYVRQLPGRIVGKTVDTEGKEGFILTLQAREQHIRREKASSNICSNQALNMLAAAVYLSYMGKSGFREAASQSAQKAHYLAKELEKVGVNPCFNSSFYNEFVVKVSDVKPVQERLLSKGIVFGLLLGDYYPELNDCVLVCVTELNAIEEMDQVVEALK